MEELRKVFNAGLKCNQLHPDDDSYDEIHYKKAAKKFVNESDIINKLKKDKQLFNAYKANIAMAYMDNWHWYSVKNKKKFMNRKDRHTIANNSAEYFLKLLIA